MTIEISTEKRPTQCERRVGERRFLFVGTTKAMFNSAPPWWRGSAAISRLAAVVSFLLTLGIATDVTRTVLDVIVANRRPAPAGAAAKPTARGPRVDSTRIVAAHLFGSAPQESHEKPEAAERLALTGVIASADPRNGYAIVSGGSGASHLYHTGTEAFLGVVLSEVFSDHVVLERYGETLVLAMPRQPGGVVGQPVRRRAVVAANAGSGVTSPAPVLSPEDLKPPRMSDAGAIAGGLGGRAIPFDGELGLRVAANNRNHEALTVLGLQPNDVIVAINGQPMSTHPNLTAALQQGDTTLMVAREGGRTAVMIDSASASAAAELIRAATHY
jgi:type II secretory pathway component PulC